MTMCLHTHSTFSEVLKQIPVLEYIPYLPDLAPCDFFMFQKLKNHLDRASI